MIRKIFFISIAGLITVLFLGCGGKEGKTGKPKVWASFVMGSVEKSRDLSASGWQKLNVNDELSVNNVVRTKSDSMCELSSEESVLKVMENSVVVLKDVFSKDSKVMSWQVEEGKIGAIVRKLVGGSEFRVSTASAVMAVRGTEFVVERTKGKTTLLVKKGKVLMAPKVEGVPEDELIAKAAVPIESGEKGELSDEQVKKLSEEVKKGVPVEKAVKKVKAVPKKVKVSQEELKELDKLLREVKGGQGESGRIMNRGETEEEHLEKLKEETAGGKTEAEKITERGKGKSEEEYVEEVKRRAVGGKTEAEKIMERTKGKSEEQLAEEAKKKVTGGRKTKASEIIEESQNKTEEETAEDLLKRVKGGKSRRVVDTKKSDTSQQGETEEDEASSLLNRIKGR